MRIKYTFRTRKIRDKVDHQVQGMAWTHREYPDPVFFNIVTYTLKESARQAMNRCSEGLGGTAEVLEDTVSD